MDNGSRLGALKRAAFRASVCKNGGSFCRICQGRTKLPDFAFCLRHFRELPPDLHGNDNIAAAEAYLRAPRPLRFARIKGSAPRRAGGNPLYITSSGRYQIYVSSDRSGKQVLILRDGSNKHELGRYHTIAEAQKALSELYSSNMIHNPWATKTLIR